MAMPGSRLLKRISAARGRVIFSKKTLSIAVSAIVVLASAAVVAVYAWPEPGRQEDPQNAGPIEEPDPDPGADGRGYVLLTFDDGGKSVHQYGLPIMAAAGIPGTVFMVTDAIGGSFEGRPMMSAADLRDLQGNGWEVGSHSQSHADFSRLSPQEADQELRGSKAALEAIGINITSFAYPWGRDDQADVAAAAEVYDRQRSGYGPLDSRGLNLQDYSPGIPVVGSVTPSSLGHVKQLIDQAIATDSVTVFLFHEVSTTGDLGTPLEETNLRDVVDYIAEKRGSDGLQAITFSQLPTYKKECYVWDGGGADELASTKENWYKVNATGQIVNDAPLAPKAHYVWSAVSSKNCIWDLDARNFTAWSFTITQGYTGVVRQGSVDIGLGLGGFYQGGGTFVGNVSKTIHSSGGVTVVSGVYAEGTVNWDLSGEDPIQYIDPGVTKELPAAKG